MRQKARTVAATLVALWSALALVAAKQLNAENPPPSDIAKPPLKAASAVVQGRQRLFVAQFDRNGDGRLNAEERQAAYELAAQTAKKGKGGGKGGKPGENLEPARPGPKLTPAAVQLCTNAPLYDPATLRTFFLEFDRPDWEKELSAFHRTDVDIPATLIVDGRRLDQVGVHFHGASSFDKISEGHKRSLVISLDFVHDDQRLYGYRTLRLLNAHEDPSFLRTVLSQQISRHYIPAPKANLARLVINGESWGIYVNVQHFNKDFLKEWYGTTKGSRWKVVGGQQGGLVYLGENPEDYRRSYEIKSKDEPQAWTNLIRLCRALQETPAESLEQTLAPLLAVDETLKFLALENVLMNKDGYWTKGSDHNLYLDDKGIFHLVPYDANETFYARSGKDKPGGGKKGPPMARPEGMAEAATQTGHAPNLVGLDPLVAVADVRRPLLSKLLQAPALRERYLGYVRDIANQWLDWNRLGPLALQYRELIEAEVKADTRKLYSYQAFAQAFADEPDYENGRLAGVAISLKTFADKRRAFLLNNN